MLRRARELGIEVGMLRHERVLAAPGDVAALLADPLLPAELRSGYRRLMRIDASVRPEIRSRGSR